MITALVQFQLPEPVSLERAQELFLSTAPKYRGIEGLVRKYYLLSEDGSSVGGVYLWTSREDAERLYTYEWENAILSKYGAQPTVTYFETPIIVDNVVGEISTST